MHEHAYILTYMHAIQHAVIPIYENVHTMKFIGIVYTDDGLVNDNLNLYQCFFLHCIMPMKLNFFMARILM